MTGPGGLIPEQIWDTDAIPACGLYPGKPSGSAMPLVWAHAEFLKLLAAQANGRPVEMLEPIERRYGGKIPNASVWHWRPTCPISVLPKRKSLLIEQPEPFLLHFGFNGWRRPTDQQSSPTQFGMHGVTLAADELAGATSISFTFYFTERSQWLGQDFSIPLATR
jgi:glucoamylase